MFDLALVIWKISVSLPERDRIQGANKTAWRFTLFSEDSTLMPILIERLMESLLGCSFALRRGT
ncbi:MAG TPA: hypothetical protein V6D11_09400 [Waterburya sp.]